MSSARNIVHVKACVKCGKSARGILRNGDAEYKTKSLDDTKPKTNPNPSTNPLLLFYVFSASPFCKMPVSDFPHSAFYFIPACYAETLCCMCRFVVSSEVFSSTARLCWLPAKEKESSTPWQGEGISEG